MSKDVNKIIENLSNEWASQSINDKRTIAILTEEVRVLNEQLDELKAQESEE